MSVVAPPEPTRTLPPDDPELLICEARERQRRRRIRTALVLAALGLAATGAYGIDLVRGGGTATIRAPGGPVVDAQVFAGHGRLAFVSRGRLFVLDGSTRKLVAVTHSAGASGPVFSPDGRWLAWSAGTRIGVALSDGTGTHVLAARGFAPRWLPDGRLVVGRALYRIAGGAVPRRDGRTPAGLVAWSADGTRYAFTTRSVRPGSNGSFRGGEQVSVAPSLSGPRTVWYELPISFTRANGFRGNAVTQVAVPPSGGLLLWLDPGQSASIAADGLAVYELTSPHGYLHRLGVTVGDSASVAGRKIALGSGAGREAWTSKQVVTCERGRCATLQTTAASLTLDPAWSPDGTTLAYVSADAERAPLVVQSALRRWYETRRLWLLRPGRGLQVVDGPTGAAAPVWSADGRSLLFVAADGLWLVPSIDAKPVEIASPLFPPESWPSSAGRVPWPAQFAWSAGA